MGLSFKDVLFSDVDTFLNPDEFAEKHFIDGRQMTVSIDGNEVIERSKKQTDKGRTDGIYEGQIIIYVSRKEFGLLPAIGRKLTMDKREYLIQDAVDEGGMYSITLGAKKI